ncbi:hypothetical protein KR009_003750, partial [Drosophila setifemur]
ETEGSMSGEGSGRAKARTISSEESPGSSSSSSGLNSWTILPVEKEGDGAVDGDANPTDPKGGQGEKHANDSKLSRLAAEDPQPDDISDGISIISDCESTDRISPNLFLREPLSDLGFGDLPPTPIVLGASSSGVQELKELHRRRELELLHEPDHLEEEPEQERKLKQRRRQASAPVVRSHLEVIMGSSFMPPLVQNGLTAVFYVGATLAILAFIGKLRHPEWQVLGDKPLAELERRVGELELQNNLLRAEIDIMSKQLQYLGSGSGQEGGRRSMRTKERTFKAWPGNGNSVDPVDITKADLKHPFKCPDGQFVEIAAMCLENKQPQAESLADEIGGAVNDVLQQSRAFRNFEKATEKLSALEGADARPQGQPSASKERFKPKFHKEPSSQEAKQHQQHHHRRPGRGRSAEDDRSKERGQRKHQDHHSRERFNKNRKKQEDNDDSGSGEWHERMMQQRENARHKHAQKRNNNWFIERGDSREKMRSGESGR